MPKKSQPPQVYKTETQLKEEAAVKKAAEAEAEAAVQKSELQKKHENFWYHYKWHTIAGVFAAFMLIFFVKDTVFRLRPDATVVIVTNSYLVDGEIENLSSVLEGYATDFNGDKKIVISTDFISLPSVEGETGQNKTQVLDPTGGQQDMANAMKLMAVLAANSDPIYLLDEAAYNYISNMGKDEDGEVTGDAFEAFSVPVEKLGGDAADAFKGMCFYLRATYSDENYYEYCKQLLMQLDKQ